MYFINVLRHQEKQCVEPGEGAMLFQHPLQTVDPSTSLKHYSIKRIINKIYKLLQIHSIGWGRAIPNLHIL